MSKPKYLRNDASPVSIIVSIEAFIKYMYTITNNEKQFPKAYRYTLTAEIRNTCLKMHRHAYRAIAIKPRYRKQYKKHVKEQQKVYQTILDMKALLIIATSVASIQNLEHLTLLMNNVIENYNKWVKNDRRLYKNLPSHKELIKMQHKANELRRQRREEWMSLPRDDEGFILLNRSHAS
ncbi:hypothetical protein [uncultured Duncaniella sp.]|uniref:hypothetical protein n=1 Tax=uncultured Duncaniella sp. TaxID=2768039 RepID=UPI002618885D|nr:hypothetical protein [uncultured Duncaniella sp.]